VLDTPKINAHTELLRSGQIENNFGPLKNVQFCSRSRKAKILTAGIHDKYFED
jgi:hypothetical protein